MLEMDGKLDVVCCCCFVFFLQTYDNEGRYYECDPMPFMEIGSVAHKYYLLNIRLPVNERQKVNVGIGEIKDIRLVVGGHLILSYTVDRSFICDLRHVWLES